MFMYSIYTLYYLTIKGKVRFDGKFYFVDSKDKKFLEILS